ELLGGRLGDQTIAEANVDRWLRGDIAAVVRKAIAARPADRYRSAAELAADLRRCLASDPVAARAPTVLYRLGKFLARRQIAVVAAAATLALLTLAVLAAWQSRRDREHVLALTNYFLQLLPAVDPAQPESPESKEKLARLLDEMGSRAPELLGAELPTE